MKIQKVWLLYFSPTGTTKSILESIADGIGADAVEPIDATYPDMERRTVEAMKKNDLLVIGAPVYSGRLPETAIRRFRTLKANGSPAVAVVLYGNKGYHDALLELTDLVREAGFSLAAAGAFIGEHSFSTAAAPLSKGRPDTSDFNRAREFGSTIGLYLRNVQIPGDIFPPKPPGNRPFRERSQFPKTSPETEPALCTACGVCVSRCPTGSISIDTTSRSNAQTCILCCACVRACPANARALKDPFFLNAIGWLSLNAAERKDPETFIGGGSLLQQG